MPGPFPPDDPLMPVPARLRLHLRRQLQLGHAGLEDFAQLAGHAILDGRSLPDARHLIGRLDHPHLADHPGCIHELHRREEPPHPRILLDRQDVEFETERA